MARKFLDQRGYTLIETLVIAPIMMMTVITITGYLFSIYTDLLISNAQLNLRTDAEFAILRMEEDIKYARSYSATVPFYSKPTDPPGGVEPYRLFDSVPPAQGSWDVGATVQNDQPQPKLIVTSFVTDKRASDPTKEVIYLKMDSNGNVMDQTYCWDETNKLRYLTPSINSYVYYLSPSRDKLYKRFIPNVQTQSSACNPASGQPNFQDFNGIYSTIDPSCACSIADNLLAENVSNLQVTYFGIDNVEQATPSDTSTRIKLSLTLSKRVANKEISATSELIVKKINTVSGAEL